MRHLQRIPTKHGYHDGFIQDVRYRGDEDVFFDVSLCSCCNDTAGFATIGFMGVRNFDSVRTSLEAAGEENHDKGFVDEIICVLRHKERGYLLGMQTAGELWIDAKDLWEA